MLNKEHITRGEATIIQNSALVKVGVITYRPEAKLEDFEDIDEYDRVTEVESVANAAFIADCFNGFNRTGKSYSELEEREAKLEEALSNILAFSDHLPDGCKVNVLKAKQLLNK